MEVRGKSYPLSVCYLTRTRLGGIACVFGRQCTTQCDFISAIPVRRYLHRSTPSVDLLVTAVDLNLGFTGSSYRAANWQQWMSVKARPYLYDNGCYVTPRQLRESFGTSSLMDLHATYPGRFQQSRVRLLDPMIYCSNLNGGTEIVVAQHRRRLSR
jgi:hypothetical protein